VWVKKVRFQPDRVIVEVALRRGLLQCPRCEYTTAARKDTRNVDSVWRHLDRRSGEGIAGIDERESQAFKFALALLVPADEFILDIAHTRRRWADFLRLREKWGTSAAALARRAHQLGIVNKDAYRIINIERRKRGHWNREPGDVPLEHPSVFDDAVTILRDRAGWSLGDFAEAAGLPEHRLRDLLPEQFASGVAPVVGLRRVK
jgi:hypothetical protein